MELVEKSLRNLTTNRLIDDLIENSLQLAQDSFTLIIVDSYSAKLLSNYLTMTDILNKGIFSVESIIILDKISLIIMQFILFLLLKILLIY